MRKMAARVIQTSTHKLYIPLPPNKILQETTNYCENHLHFNHVVLPNRPYAHELRTRQSTAVILIYCNM